MNPPVCDDCTRPGPLRDAADRCYAFCTVCGIKRACFGDDPEPTKPRVKRLPAWPADPYPLR